MERTADPHKKVPTALLRLWPAISKGLLLPEAEDELPNKPKLHL